MGRFARSWALAKASWSVLRADKELLVLPVISGLLTLVVMAGFAIPIFLTGHTDATTADGTTGSTFRLGPPGYVLGFLMYFVLAYVTIFFNTALVCAADERMRGGDPTLGSALRGALSRAGAIAPWALISATVSVILRSLEQRAGLLGRIAIGLVGMAWSLVTFLVLPILVLERVSAVAAIKRSASLFKRTWGENVIANAAVGIIGFIALLIALPFVLFAVFTGFTPAIVASVVGAVLWMAFVGIVLSALGVIYQVALYRYAVDGTPPPAFAAVDLSGAFRPKRGR